MIKLSLNILSNQSTLNHIPMYFEFSTTRDLTNFIRESTIDILDWTFQSFGQTNNTRIGLYVREDIDSEEFWEWKFIIDCKNIRDFQPYIKMNFDEFNQVSKQKMRQDKISDLID